MIKTIYLYLVLILSLFYSSSLFAQNSLNNGQLLKSGSSLFSNNGKFEAKVTTGGNFVINLIQGEERILIWQTLSFGEGCELELSKTGTLSLKKNGVSKWYNGYSGVAALSSAGINYKLVMKDNGNLVIEYANNEVWATNTVTVPEYYTASLEIISLKCNKTSENGEDEIYFETPNKSIEASDINMKNGDEIYLNLTIPLNPKTGECKFNIMEDDHPGDDLIGTLYYRYGINNIPFHGVPIVYASGTDEEETPANFNGDGSSYTLKYKFIPNRYLLPTPIINPINPSFLVGSAYNGTDSKSEKWLVDYSKNWMGKLDSTTRLVDLSIPGTHNSGAKLGTEEIQNQSLSIKEQLYSGIRFFDIRIAPFRKSTSHAYDLWVFHGKALEALQDITLGHVLADVTNFLEEQPNETIIMEISGTNTPENDNSWYDRAGGDIPFNYETVKRELEDNYFTKYSKYFYLNEITKSITLDTLRGKIVLRRNFKGLTDQDDNEVTAFSSTEKQTQVKDAIDSKINNDSLFYFNWLNGNAGMQPYDVAKNVCPAIFEYLIKKPYKSRLGLIIMDYPGEWLIYRIIQSNFSYP